MKPDFSASPLRRGTHCAKWDTYAEDVLPLWVADMDFPSPEPVTAALQQAAASGCYGYPSWIHPQPGEKTPIHDLLTGRLEQLYRWKIDADDLVFLPGVVVGLNLTCHTFAAEGGQALVLPPIYPPFLRAASHARLQRVDVECTTVSLPGAAPNTLHYELDYGALERAINPASRLLLFCNPHNPTGRVYTRAELEKLAEICLAHDLAICSDEIHGDLVYAPNRHIPIASLDPEIAQRTITLMAPSKTYNIPGLQFSFAVIQNSHLRRQFLEATRGLVMWANLMGWVAAEAAYRHGQPWLDQLLLQLAANRQYTANFVTKNMPGMRMTIPQGTYLAWLDCRSLQLPDGAYNFFLDKARVALNDGKTFGAGGDGFVRLNFACPPVTLQEALERMASALAAR